MNTESFLMKLISSPDVCIWSFAAPKLLELTAKESYRLRGCSILHSPLVGLKSDFTWFANVATALVFASDAAEHYSSYNFLKLAEWFSKCGQMPDLLKKATDLQDFKRALDLMTLLAHFSQLDRDSHYVYEQKKVHYVLPETQYEMVFNRATARYFLDVFTSKFEAVSRSCGFSPLSYLPMYAYAVAELEISARKVAIGRDIELKMCPLVEAISQSKNSDFIEATETLKRLAHWSDFARIFVSSFHKIACNQFFDWTKPEPSYSGDTNSDIENLPVVCFLHLACRLIAAGGVDSPFAQTFYAEASDELIDQLMVQCNLTFATKQLTMHRIDPLVFLIQHADTKTRQRWLRRHDSQCEGFGTVMQIYCTLGQSVPNHMWAQCLGPYLCRVAAMYGSFKGNAPFCVPTLRNVKTLFNSLARFATTDIENMQLNLDRRCFAMTAAILLADLVQTNKHAMKLYKKSAVCRDGKLIKAMRSNLQYLLDPTAIWEPTVEIEPSVLISSEPGSLPKKTFPFRNVLMFLKIILICGSFIIFYEQFILHMDDIMFKHYPQDSVTFEMP